MLRRVLAVVVCVAFTGPPAFAGTLLTVAPASVDILASSASTFSGTNASGGTHVTVVSVAANASPLAFDGETWNALLAPETGAPVDLDRLALATYPPATDRQGIWPVALNF